MQHTEDGIIFIKTQKCVTRVPRKAMTVLDVPTFKNGKCNLNMALK